MHTYEQRRDHLLVIMRKQNALWERNMDMEEKARKPLKPKKPMQTVELLNQIPRKRH